MQHGHTGLRPLLTLVNELIPERDPYVHASGMQQNTQLVQGEVSWGSFWLVATVNHNISDLLMLAFWSHHIGVNSG